MSLCPECLGRGFVYSPGGFAPRLQCPTCEGEDTAWADSDPDSPALTPDPTHDK